MSRKIPNLDEKVKEEGFEVFEKHNANENLARTLCLLFHPVSHEPLPIKLNERVKGASSDLNFQYLSFDMLLRGETEKAKEYMEKAMNLESGRTVEKRREIFNNIYEVQRVLSSSKDELNELRKENNNRPFEDFIY